MYLIPTSIRFSRILLAKAPGKIASDETIPPAPTRKEYVIQKMVLYFSMLWFG